MLDRPRSEVVWEYWLHTPFASFPFTSPPVRHCVPPGSERALPPLTSVQVSANKAVPLHTLRDPAAPYHRSLQTQAALQVDYPADLYIYYRQQASWIYQLSQQLFVTNKSTLLHVEINRRIRRYKIGMPTKFVDITDVKNWEPLYYTDISI